MRGGGEGWWWKWGLGVKQNEVKRSARVTVNDSSVFRLCSVRVFRLCSVCVFRPWVPSACSVRVCSVRVCSVRVLLLFPSLPALPRTHASHRSAYPRRTSRRRSPHGPETQKENTPHLVMTPHLMMTPPN